MHDISIVEINESLECFNYHKKLLLTFEQNYFLKQLNMKSLKQQQNAYHMHIISIAVLNKSLECFKYHKKRLLTFEKNYSLKLCNYSHVLSKSIKYKKRSQPTKYNCIMITYIYDKTVFSNLAINKHNLALSTLPTDTIDKIMYHKQTKTYDVHNCPVSKHNYLLFNILFSHQFYKKTYLIMLNILYFQNGF